jgi:uncharacterized membrane protein
MNPRKSTPSAPAEEYLTRLRIALGRLPETEIDDIVRELRSHILERQEMAGKHDDEHVMGILGDLGSPEEIGALYQAEALVARARSSHSPLLILASTARLARRSLVGLLAFMLAVFGYVFGGGCIVLAAMKPFMPDRIGFWISEHRHSIGWLPKTEHAQDVLGWSIIPAAMIFGVFFIAVTTALLRWLLRFVLPSRKIQFTKGNEPLRQRRPAVNPD